MTRLLDTAALLDWLDQQATPETLHPSNVTEAVEYHHALAAQDLADWIRAHDNVTAPRVVLHIQDHAAKAPTAVQRLARSGLLVDLDRFVIDPIHAEAFPPQPAGKTWWTSTAGRSLPHRVALVLRAAWQETRR